MSLKNINPTTTNAWQNLRNNFNKIESTHLHEFFEQKIDMM